MAQKARSRFATIRDTLFAYFVLTVGATIAGAGVMLFLVPVNIAPGGVSGVAVLLNHTIGTPIGIMVMILNIPIQILGYYMLPDGWRMVVRTIYTLVVYTISLELFGTILPPEGISSEPLLNALFGGVVGGLGGGIIMRYGASFGGTSTLALIIQNRTGLPLNSIYLYTDTAVIGAAGLIFGWEAAMFAIVTLFIDGTAANYILEGPSVIRTAVIVTDKPKEVSDVILHKLVRGATGWDATGMYTGQERYMLYVTVSRTQVRQLRQLVTEVDPDVFMVIGHGHAAYGEGFKMPSRAYAKTIASE